MKHSRVRSVHRSAYLRLGEMLAFRRQMARISAGYAKTDLDRKEVVADDGPLARVAAGLAGVGRTRLVRTATTKRADLTSDAAKVAPLQDGESQKREEHEARTAELVKQKVDVEITISTADERRSGRSLMRRSYETATEVHLSLVASVAGVDITLIGLAQQVLPGKDMQHWVSAACIGAVLAGLGHAIGELVAALFDDDRVRPLATKVVLASVTVVLIGAVLVAFGLQSMTTFRNLGLVSESDTKIPDPTYLGWVQAIAIYAAALSSAVWRTGESGRADLVAINNGRKQVDAIDEELASIRQRTARSIDRSAKLGTYASTATAAAHALGEQIDAGLNELDAVKELLHALGVSTFDMAKARRKRRAELDDPRAHARRLRAVYSAGAGMVAALGAVVALDIAHVVALLLGGAVAALWFAVVEPGDGRLPSAPDLANAVPPELLDVLGESSSNHHHNNSHDDQEITS